MSRQSPYALTIDRDVFPLVANCLVNLCVRPGLASLTVNSQRSMEVFDWSDVIVVTPDEEIPGAHLSRLSDPEMRNFNAGVLNRAFTFLRSPSILVNRETYDENIGLPTGTRRLPMVPGWHAAHHLRTGWKWRGST